MKRDDFRARERMKASAVIEKAFNGCCFNAGEALKCADRAAKVLAAQDIYIPPCQTGDTVYRIDDKRYFEYAVLGFMVKQYKSYLIIQRKYAPVEDSLATIVETSAIGKSLFLTKQTADEHLKGSK